MGVTEQTEAQRLADRLDLYATGDKHQKDIEDAAAELRRLDAELERKSDAIQRLWAERDSLRASMAQLLKALKDIAYQLEKSRIWGGMDWHYNPLHPSHYLPARDKARAAIAAAKEQA
jgi:DNA repair exonuclease SbcCD ATPase subunit